MSVTVVAIGNLGREPEMRYTNDGSPVVEFSLACRNASSSKETPIWLRVSTFRGAENHNNYLNKGDRVQVIGAITEDKWTDRDGNPRVTWNVRADSIQYISTKRLTMDQTIEGGHSEVLEEVDEAIKATTIRRREKPL